VVVLAEAYGEVGDTTSSCHVFLGIVAPCLGFIGPVGVTMVEEAGIDDCRMFWKTWIGSASKNSCARMKGVDVTSGDDQLKMHRMRGNVPFGTSRMSSHHCMLTPGMYFRGAVHPMSFFCNSSVPARSFACCFCRCGDASTR
jgi:hypothetical protein